MKSSRGVCLLCAILSLLSLVPHTASQNDGTVYATCTKKVDICFVVDQSGSIVDDDPGNWQLVKNFIYNIIESFDIGYDQTRVGLVTFANQGITRWNLTAHFDRSSIRNALGNLVAGNGRTRTHMGLNKMRREVFNVNNDRRDVQNVAIVITDGKSTDHDSTVREAQLAKGEGVQMFVVGVTRGVNEEELKDIASPPQEINKNYWTTPDFRDLTDLVSSLQTETCSQSIPQACQQADIAILVDSSTSVRGQWNALKESLKRLVDGLKIGPDRVRVGIINFSGKALLQFDLDDHTTGDALKSAIDKMEALSTDTKTYTALELLQELFTPSRGDRGHVNNMVILFTDGEESNPDLSFRTIKAAEDIKRTGARILVVGMGAEVRDEELKKIATSPLDVFLPDFNNLLTEIGHIVEVACSDPVEWNQCDIADVVLVLDRSTSIIFVKYENWLQVLRFADDIVTAFGVGKNATHWGVVTFATNARVEFDLDDHYDKGNLSRAIKNITHTGGETNIADAIRKTTTLFSSSTTLEVQGDRPFVKNIVIFLTDGNANRDWKQVQTEIKVLKQKRVEVFAIGVTEDVNVDQLNEIATAPNRTYVYTANDFNTLRREVRKILKNACIIQTTTSTTSTTTTTTTSPTTTTTSSTTTTTTPTTTTSTTTTTSPTTTTTSPTTTTTSPTTTTTSPTTTTTSATTTTTSPTTTTTSPTTTTTSPTTTTTSPTTTTTSPTTTTTSATTTTTSSTTTSTTTTTSPSKEIICKGDGADIVFVMDASGSINEINFKKILDFVAEVILVMDTTNKIRVGAMTFSDNPTVVFQLDRYTNAGDMVNAIRNVRYSRQTTNTASALNVLRTQLFTPNTGDRPNFQNIAVIITDGESNDKDDTLREAVAAKTAGITILTLGIGSWLDMNELQNMASYPYQRNMYHVDKFDALAGLRNTLRDYGCGNNQICVENNPCRNGARCNPKPNGYQCVCFPPWTGQNCTNVCDDAADVIIALDASGSIGKENFQKSLDFLALVVESLDVDRSSVNSGTRIGFLTFSNGAVKQFDLNQFNSRNQVLEALSVRYVGGTTNTAAALQYIRENMFTAPAGDRPGVNNYIILLTDGQANDAKAAWAQARATRDAGIQILAIGIGQGINKFELESIASLPADKNVLIRENFQSLDSDLQTQIYSSLCANNKICPRMTPCLNGGTCTDIMNGYICRCPPDFAGIDCGRGCDGKVDLAFVLDSSGSIRIERFPEVKEFLVNITKSLDVQPDRVRVGMVYWSDDAQVNFRLNEFKSRQDIINAIRATPFLGAKTNTASALGLLRNDIFQPRNGDRPDARNIAVMVSDGNSNIQPENTFPEAAAAREDGIYMMGVAVGNKFANMVEMEGIVSIPSKENVFNVSKYSQLNDVVSVISSGTCDDVDECRSNPCQNGGRCRNDLKRYFCDCNPGFVGYTCQERCSRQLDVVFVLDISGSVEAIYQMTVKFAKQVVYGLDMTLDRTRIAALTYATDYNPAGQFFLNKYQGNKQGVINALNFFHNGGRTNTQAGLNMMRTQHFTSFRGDRPGVPNVAILITDGYSNEFESNTIPEATRAKNNGVRLYTVGLGDNPNMRELNSISSDPDSEFVFRLRQPSEVESVAQDILRQLCQ